MLRISLAMQQLCEVFWDPGGWVATLNICNPHKEIVSGRLSPINSFLACQPCSYPTSQRWAITSMHIYFLDSSHTNTHTHTQNLTCSCSLRRSTHTFFLIHTNIHTLLLCFPNGLWGTDWWQLHWHQYLLWNTTASEGNSSRCCAHSSRITSAWTNSITASITQVYIPGEKAHCLPRTPVSVDYTAAKKSWEKGRGNMKLIFQWLHFSTRQQFVVLKQYRLNC